MSVPLLLVFDWETTGLTLHPDADARLQPRAIEFGGALIDCSNGAVVDTRTMLIHPGKDIEPIITKITGITNDVLAHEGNFAERYPEVRKWFGRATGMLSHNLPFDKAILAGELMRLSSDADGGVHSATSVPGSFPWPRVELCTVGLYKEHWGRNPKLIELYAHVMGHPLAQTHRAMDDVNALVEIVQKERLWELVK